MANNRRGRAEPTGLRGPRGHLECWGAPSHACGTTRGSSDSSWAARAGWPTTTPTWTSSWSWKTKHSTRSSPGGTPPWRLWVRRSSPSTWIPPPAAGGQARYRAQSRLEATLSPPEPEALYAEIELYRELRAQVAARYGLASDPAPEETLEAEMDQRWATREER